jgi:glycosyltransferase involved in cell wall biosynthesis
MTTAATMLAESPPPKDSGSRALTILFAVPDFSRFSAAMQSSANDAAYLLLSQMAQGLQQRGHNLTFFGGVELTENVSATALFAPSPARGEWTDTALFSLVARVSWILQRLLRIPYLNVFSNWRLKDGAAALAGASDVVYERNGMYRDGLARACAACNTPYVLFVDADELLEHDCINEPVRGLLRLRAALAFRRNLAAAVRIICVSEATRQRLVEHWGVSRDKISVLPNAVDAQMFRPNVRARQALRTRHHLEDRPVVLFVGSFYIWHDVTTLLKAFAQVRDVRPDSVLFLVGDGRQRPLMEDLAREIGLSESVHFLGSISHSKVPEYLAAADIVVAPYIRMQQEMWFSPMKVYEAMASATPLVASATGQIRDVLRDGEDALLVEPEDTYGLAAAILSLLNDPERGARIGAAARARAVDRFSLESHAAQLSSVLESAASRHV